MIIKHLRKQLSDPLVISMVSGVFYSYTGISLSKCEWFSAIICFVTALYCVYRAEELMASILSFVEEKRRE